jgi:intracellular multiplication protein IcmS
MLDISKKLVAIAKKLKVGFTFKDRPIPLEEVFAETGLLPGLTKRANQLASLCLGYGLGASFEETEGSLLGNKVIYDDFTPDALRLLCITDVINELIKNSSTRELVPLDELMYD